MKQKILIMTTLTPDLRSGVDSWDWEDGNIVKLDKEIGLSGSGQQICYKTPLHAIGDGWRLIAPPVTWPDYAPGVTGYEWWFEKL